MSPVFVGDLEGILLGTRVGPSMIGRKDRKAEVVLKQKKSKIPPHYKNKNLVNQPVGALVGRLLGAFVGRVDGLAVETVGDRVGTRDGRPLGTLVGRTMCNFERGEKQRWIKWDVPTEETYATPCYRKAQRWCIVLI